MIHRMAKTAPNAGLTRRQLLQLSGATALTAGLALPRWMMAELAEPPANLYATLLQTWCDGLISHQLTETKDPALRGALLCPACALIHGRCGDAVYPLLRVAHTTGDAKYLNAALLVYEWTEHNVSRADGSWINDVTLSSWQGITVFHTIALAEAVQHHGAVLDTATRQRWTDRIARAAKFLDGFISIQTGNINYPVTACYCFALCGQLLSDSHYTDRARKLAHTVLDYFTENGLLYGEGHPLDDLSAKHCRPVDLGYNVEESLPALTLYSLLTNDKAVLDRTISSARAHLDFMLPDGAWDNSWGTRNYKWSYWGSRTSDGCHPAFALLADHEPQFREVALRNLELMAACTHNNLLYGGPDYRPRRPPLHPPHLHPRQVPGHGPRPSHRPAARTSSRTPPRPTLRPQVLPRDRHPPRRHRPLARHHHRLRLGVRRARVQSGNGGAGGGHATGGARSLLYHQTLGPICTASMTEYQMIEISNQQGSTSTLRTLRPHPACPVRGPAKNLLAQLSPTTPPSSPPPQPPLRSASTPSAACSPPRTNPLTTASLHYHLAYLLTATTVQITISTDATAEATAPVSFILPIIARQSDPVDLLDPAAVRITKPTGPLTIRTQSPSQGFTPYP